MMHGQRIVGLRNIKGLGHLEPWWHQLPWIDSNLGPEIQQVPTFEDEEPTQIDISILKPKFNIFITNHFLLASHYAFPLKWKVDERCEECLFYGSSF